MYANIVANNDHIHDTQFVFRKLLDSMARPGKINDIGKIVKKTAEQLGARASLATIAVTLLDGETSWTVGGKENNELNKYISRLTLSPVLTCQQADYIFIESPLDQEIIKEILTQCKKGTLIEPEKSATIIITIDNLEYDQKDDHFSTDNYYFLSGPGIKGTMPFLLPNTVQDWIRQRDSLNIEYPLGIDLIFVTIQGKILALPRTTKIERGNW